MKTRSQKLISLVLVLMMLVTMIPVGMFAANAEVSAELSAGLAAYANTTEFVINSVEDWEAVAASGKSFDGRTVKLGADINAENGTLSTLFPNGFGGTFDGQGFTVKNATLTADANGRVSLLTNYVATGTFQNVSVENVTASGTSDAGILVSWISCAANCTVTVQNVKVIGCTVTTTAEKAGAVVGKALVNDPTATVTFENILVQDTNVSALDKVGGVVGYVETNGGIASANNVEITGTTLTATATGAGTISGIFGYYSMSANNTMKINNCYVNATFALPNCPTNDWKGSVQGLAYGDNGWKGSFVEISNCVTNNTYPSVKQVTTLFLIYNATFTLSNLYSVQNTGKSGQCGSGGNTINGTTGIASNANAYAATLIDESLIPVMIEKNSDGFITSINQEGLDWELANYDSVNTFTINNVEEWNLIATSGKNFTGKTVKLGANIDAKGATLLPLAPLAVSNSGIIFDGNGYAIKNVGTAATPQTQPLITEKMSGAVIQNVTFQNIVMVGADATYGSALIADFISGWGASTIQNIKVLGCSISDTAGPAGALIGRSINNNGECFLTIDGVVIDASTTITAATYAGSVIGYISGNGGTYNINRVYTEASVTCGGENYVGGLVGYACGHPSYTSQFNFTNNVVKAKLYCPEGHDHYGRIGGIYGRATNGVDINVYNCISAPAAVTADIVQTNAIGISNGVADLDVRNSYATSGRQYYFENTDHTVNGNAVASGLYSFAGVIVISADVVFCRYSTDANGFIVDVKDHVDAEGVQSSAVSDNKYAVRFIAMSQLPASVSEAEASVITMTVVAKVNGGVTKSFTAQCTLYDALSAYDAKGIATSKTAASFNANSLAGLTIYNIPTGADITFEVTTSYTDANGLVVTGANTMTVTFNANGVCTTPAAN